MAEIDQAVQKPRYERNLPIAIRFRAFPEMILIRLKRGGDRRNSGRRLRLQFDHAIDKIGLAYAEV